MKFDVFTFNFKFFCKYLCFTFLLIPVLSFILQAFAQSNFYNNAAIINATVGFFAKNLNTNQIIVNKNADKLLCPASVQKLITTAIALEKLGSDYTYKTEIYASNKIENGILNGNLIIKGSGDPSFGSYKIDSIQGFEFVFNEFAKALKQKGIQKINGNVYGDPSFFDSKIAPPKWLWEDVGNYYGCAVSGLNFNENIFQLHVSTTFTGLPISIFETYPFLPEKYTIINNVIAGNVGSGDKSFFYSTPFSNEVYYTGTLPPNKSEMYIKGAIPNPPEIAALHLKFALQKNGIVVTGDVENLEMSNMNLPNKELLYTIESKPLKDLVKRTNEQSINLYAESLLLTLGKQFNKPNIDSSLSVLSQFISEKNVLKNSIKLYDGSGMSPMNRVSSRAIVGILEKAYMSNIKDDFMSSLPLSGINGTVKKFLNNTRLQGKMRIKSGSMTGVRSYAGYYKNNKNEIIAFCFILNDYIEKDSIIIHEIEQLFLATF